VFEEGKEVYLKLSQPPLRSLSKQSVSKLSSNFYSPYPIITRIGQVAYKLQLPKGTHVHPMFHVSPLKKSTGNNVVSQALPSHLSGEEPTATPIAIPDKRITYQQGALLTQVLVQWSLLHPDNNT